MYVLNIYVDPTAANSLNRYHYANRSVLHWVCSCIVTRETSKLSVQILAVKI